jgi:predicted MFS family arabinose efflux permease
MVTVASRVPWLVVGPFSGALSDMLQPWRGLMMSMALRVVTMAGFTALVITGTNHIAFVIVVAFFMSSIDTLGHTLKQSLVPQVRGSRSLESANSALEGSEQIATDLIGIPVGPILFSVLAAAPFGADAVFSVCALVLLWLASRGGGTMPAPTTRATVRAVGHGAAEGFRWLFAHRRLRTIAVAVCVLNASNLAVLSTAVLYAVKVLRIDPGLYGVLLLGIGIGGLLGLVAATYLVRWLGRTGTLRLGFALCPVAFAIGGLTSDVAVAVPALSLVGISTAIVTVVTISIRQDEIPAGMFGRVNGAFRVIINGISSLGGVLGGVLATVYGLRAPLLVSAATMTVATVAIMFLPSAEELTAGQDA